MRPCDRRPLQAVVAGLSLVPVAAGAVGVTLGPTLVGGGGSGDLDSHFRYLSGLLLATGAPSAPHLAALVLELAVVPALALWQASLARRSVSRRSAGRPGPPPPASRGMP